MTAPNPAPLPRRCPTPPRCRGGAQPRPAAAAVPNPAPLPRRGAGPVPVAYTLIFPTSPASCVPRAARPPAGISVARVS
jgi:hypothetical protein